MTTALFVLAALYLLSQNRMATAGGMTTQPRPATGTFTAGGTRINVPGVGEYVNVPGGGTSITIDPSVYGNLFDTFRTPQIASPTPAPDYQAYDIVSAPNDPFACADPFSPCYA